VLPYTRLLNHVLATITFCDIQNITLYLYSSLDKKAYYMKWYREYTGPN
jgi:hypothetical protein